MNKQYSAPVDKLLAVGDCRKIKDWPNYLDMGITSANIAELIEMALDEELNNADSDDPEVWAPVHAWRTLGQLQAKEAIRPLTRLFHELDDSDWVGEELPEVYSMIGRDAIAVLSEYLNDDTHSLHPRVTSAYSLERIGTKNPEARDECVLALTKQLEKFKENDPELNSFLIGYLLDLKAIESLPIMEQAYAADCVDCFVVGDFEDVEISLGLKSERQNKKTYSPFFEGNEALVSRSFKQDKMTKSQTKSKNKRNMQKQSRKKNKKRK